MEYTISAIKAREVLDSRGNPTVAAAVTLSDGSLGSAMVPSGASTGSHEALELRDKDPKRYGGKGVQIAVANVNGEIAQALIGKTFNQASLDAALIALDGTEHKERLGANAILAVSMAFLRASAAASKKPLYEFIHEISGVSIPVSIPRPMMNILNGGRHAEQSADFQEFMIVPIGAVTFAEMVRYGAETFHALKKILAEKGFPTAVGDEGGFAAPFKSNEEAIVAIIEAIRLAGYEPGKDIAIALDVAATELMENGSYKLVSEGKTLGSAEMISLYADWSARYPLISIEDGLGEDDWAGFTAMTETLGGKVQIVGDDLFVTNPERLKKGIALKAGNAILIKLNQIGTVSETIEAVKTAQAAGFGVVISHRSGETEDTTIADLAVGLGAGQIKTGSLSRSERVAKYNRLMEIEEELKRG